jgi:glutamate N-acetyltransferase/amino-acid N-acetyltransferase
VAGFRFAGVRAGLKTHGPDIALIAADAPAVVAGVLTRNLAPAAPVILTRERLALGRTSGVLVHAGNANACTGPEGLRTANAAAARAAKLLDVEPTAILPCATGRIGVQVPRERLFAGVDAAHAALDPGSFADAAHAIMTTDAFPKTAVRRLRLGRTPVTIAVMGKGAGMIAPDMATLLVFALTDARLERAASVRSLRTAADATLNRTTVDGDTSTNDTLLLLASGAAGGPVVRSGSAEWRRFTAALTNALEEIARLVVLDGEGSTRLVEVVVRGARTDADAQRIARAIATSTLCKAAFHGADPNWGRFVCAAGTAGVSFEPERVDVVIGGVVVSRRGRPQPGALRRAAARMRRRECEIRLDLRAGAGTGRMLTSDLTVEYVHFNAAYTT